jgi:hypothetical protein
VIITKEQDTWQQEKDPPCPVIVIFKDGRRGYDLRNSGSLQELEKERNWILP